MAPCVVRHLEEEIKAVADLFLGAVVTERRPQ